MLDSPMSRTLYHEFAAPLPIVDFHCHIDPSWLAKDRRFDNLADLWVVNDPYKWRAMRINGVPEERITGQAPALTKFQAWAGTVPRTIGNPLFHWSALELQRYFDVTAPLSPKTAQATWDHCNELLAGPGFTALGLLGRSHVETLCTSDDILDSLEWHRSFQGQGAIRMLPSLRADSLIDVTGTRFPAFCAKLGQMSGIAVEGLETYKAAISARLDVFKEAGCTLADMGIDQPIFEPATDDTLAAHFGSALKGVPLEPLQRAQLQTELLVFLGVQYRARGWAMQLHIGAQRATSYRLAHLVGAAGGYACIGKSADIGLLVKFLNHLEMRGDLPRTVLYTLNPSDMEMYASVTGAFVEDGVAGKVQFGPAWWLNDHRDGIERQLRALGNLGLLSRHIGMTTDSRSLLSFSRHEYYRRIFCNLVGGWVDAGELPRDMALLSDLVQDVCYRNARDWVAGTGIANH